MGRFASKFLPLVGRKNTLVLTFLGLIIPDGASRDLARFSYTRPLTPKARRAL